MKPWITIANTWATTKTMTTVPTNRLVLMRASEGDGTKLRAGSLTRSRGRARRDDVHAGRGDVRVIQRVVGDAARGEVRQHVLPWLVVRRDERLRAVVQHAMRFRVRGIDDADLASRRDADDPWCDAVWIEGVLGGAVIARREHDGDAAARDFLGRFVDRVLRIECPAGAPGVVDGLDVVLLLVIEDVIESGERKEDEQHVARADPDQIGPRCDARVVAG